MTSISTLLEPHDLRAMSVAADLVCKTLNLNEGAKAARTVIAEGIIALAQEDERRPVRLRDKILRGCGSSEQEPEISRRGPGL